MKAWLATRLKTFENAELPGHVVGVMPVYRTVADAKKDGIPRRELRKVIVFAKLSK